MIFLCYYYYKSEFNFYEEVSYVLCSKIESLKSTFTLPPESLDSKLLKMNIKISRKINLRLIRGSWGIRTPGTVTRTSV